MKKTFIALTTISFLTLASCGGTENKTESAVTENTTTDTSSTVAAPPAEAEKKTEPETAASIVGTWKLKDVDLGMTPPKGKEKTFEDMKKDMIAKTVYTFDASGTISMASPMGTISGTYTLEGDKLTTVVKGKSSSANVPTLTATDMVMTIEERGTKMIMNFQR